jgi:transposase
MLRSISGQSKRQVVQTFAVSYSTVKRLVEQYQTTNSLTPKACPVRTRQIQAAQHEMFKSQWQKDQTPSWSGIVKNGPGLQASKLAIARCAECLNASVGVETNRNKKEAKGERTG